MPLQLQLLPTCNHLVLQHLDVLGEAARSSLELFLAEPDKRLAEEGHAIL